VPVVSGGAQFLLASGGPFQLRQPAGRSKFRLFFGVGGPLDGRDFPVDQCLSGRRILDVGAQVPLRLRKQLCNRNQEKLLNRSQEERRWRK